MRLLFIFLTTIAVTQGLNVVTLRYCCGLGTEQASSGNCDKYATPISGVKSEDEASCLHSIEVCCKNQKQDTECQKGIQEAKSEQTCTDEGVKKDCCDACRLGRDSGKTQKTCSDGFGLGPPIDKAFSDCCNQILTSTTTQKPITNATTATDNYSSLPPFENVCDIGDVCAQICIPNGDSYQCACNKGFTLMGDGISCKPDKRIAKKGDRCALNNPCDHDCVDTGVAIKCTCRDGFDLAKDKKTCVDIDECALGTHDCQPNEECLNDLGGYYCDDPTLAPDDLNGNPLDVKCPDGYRYNFEKLVCDDINECEFDIICPRPKNCINTLGSFRCEGEDVPQCPPGFHFKDSIQNCSDIDECISGDNNCNKESQVCLNTVGNYTCIDKVSTKTCPPGFKKNVATQICDDINECEENERPCGADEECINEPGGHNCVKKTKNDQGTYNYPLRPPYEPALPPKPIDTGSTTSTTTTTVRPETKSTTTSTPRTTTTTTTRRVITCPTGFRYSQRAKNCIDIDECEEDNNLCDSTQECYNSPGSYICNCKSGFNKDYQTGACIDINECQVGLHDCTQAQRCDNTIGSYLCARITGCGTGYTLNYANGLCEDDDECQIGTHTCNSLGPNFKCRNTVGSFRCDVVRPKIVPRPLPPQIPKPTPTAPRIFNPPNYPTVPSFSNPSFSTKPTPVDPQNFNQPFSNPSFSTKPTPVDRQYFNQPFSNPIKPTPAVPQIFNPPFRSPTFPTTPSSQGYPFLSGARKQCLPGYTMNERGICQDINECDSNPCRRGQKCINFNGHYQCISELQCKIGYELDENGEICIDINECSRGTHKCKPSQICKNGNGYYTCECPPGHHLNPSRLMCEDIDECKFYRPCSGNAECINTVGSYQCRCKEGFKEQGSYCDDVDECTDSGLCEHSCVNLWGSYRCACKAGFTLNYDNRTCTDVDECDKFKDKRLCVGNCENVPGSYKCSCPNGYKLGSDGRTCIDIDECLHNVCPRPGDICLNTRGGHKCYTINCPSNYIRDPQHKGRCKRPPALCDPRDVQCILMPEQYTYHYISMVSDLPISSKSVQFFQINGPKWLVARAEFSMEVVNVHAPAHVERVNERFFKMIKPAHNTMQLYLIRSISGPQEIELKVEMDLFQGNIMTAKVVSYIFIVVTEYTF